MSGIYFLWGFLTPLLSFLLTYTPYILFIQNKQNIKKNKLKDLSINCLTKYQQNLFLLKENKISYEDFLKDLLPYVLVLQNFYSSSKKYKDYKKEYFLEIIFNFGNQILIKKTNLKKEEKDKYLKLLYLSFKIPMGIKLDLDNLLKQNNWNLYKKIQDKKNYKKYKLDKLTNILEDIKFMK